MVRKFTHSNFGTLNPFSYLERENFGSKSYYRTVNETYSFYDDVVSWQSDVYEISRELLSNLGIKQVVDIGSGSGKKHKLIVREVDVIVAVDSANYLVDDEMENRVFQSANLTNYQDLKRLEELINSDPTLFIIADVLEHLTDIRPLLRTLRRLLKKNPMNKAILSTPDRSFGRSRFSGSEPENRSHVREWTGLEFRGLLGSTAFNILEFGHVPAHDKTETLSTTYLIVECNHDYYNDFFENLNLPQPSNHLRIINEHADLNESGGIGTYWKLSEKLLSNPPINLFVGTLGLPNFGIQNFIEGKKWFHVSQFSKKVNWLSSFLDYDGILDAVLEIVFWYDQIEFIEYADYLGLGFRVAQASRAGLLPIDVETICYCHGNCFYLDFAAEKISLERDLEIDIKERIGIESSDQVVFPSEFLQSLYQNTLSLDIEFSRRLKYPYPESENLTVQDNFAVIDTIVFFGRATPQKGFDLFLDSLDSIEHHYPNTKRLIKKIIFAGVSEYDLPARVRSSWEVSTFKGSRSEALNLLSGLQSRALVVLPYRADNQPFAVYDVISTGCRPLFANKGGIPEQLNFSQDKSEKILFDLSAISLAKAISGVVESETSWERFMLVKEMQQSMRVFFETHNKQFEKNLLLNSKNNLGNHTKELLSYSVVISSLNGSKDHLVSSLHALVNSVYPPSLIVLVNDCSDDAHSFEMERVVAETTRADIKLVTNQQNMGLAASRNIGLNLVETPLVLIQDDDNIVLPQFTYLASRIMSNDPEVDIVSSWSTYFSDGESWETKDIFKSDGYSPIGADSGLGLMKNTFGDASSMYRMDTLRSIGSWDESTKSKWEDWQLFLSYSLKGRKHVLIPATMLLYRVKANSMLRNYSDFYGWLRMMHVLPVPKNQQYSLLRFLLRKSSRTEGSQNLSINSNPDIRKVHLKFKSKINVLIKARLRILLISIVRKLRQRRALVMLIRRIRRSAYLSRMLNRIIIFARHKLSN